MLSLPFVPAKKYAGKKKKETENENEMKKPSGVFTLQVLYLLISQL